MGVRPSPASSNHVVRLLRLLLLAFLDLLRATARLAGYALLFVWVLYAVPATGVLLVGVAHVLATGRRLDGGFPLGMHVAYTCAGLAGCLLLLAEGGPGARLAAWLEPPRRAVDS